MIKPIKRLSQNFLLKPNKFVELIPKDRNIVEIGCGTGAITSMLLKRGHRVFGVEIDGRFQPILEQLQANYPKFNYEIADILCHQPIEIEHPILVGNIPFSISGPLLASWCEQAISRLGYFAKNTEIIVLVQKEFGEKLLKDSKLSVLIKSVFDIDLLREFPNAWFSPKPKTDSVCIKLVQKDSILTPNSFKILVKLLRTAYTCPNKILGSRLNVDVDFLENASITPKDRPRNVSVESWTLLANLVEKSGVEY